MKRFTIPTIIIICLFTFTPLKAEINWHENETDFSYRINHLSFFIYSLNQYHNDYNNIFTSASYGTAAETTPVPISEFENPLQPGSGIRIQGQAMGHENGTGPRNADDPPYSIKARAYLSTVAGSLNDQHGADIDLEAVSRVIHRFDVNQQGSYSVSVGLTGNSQFDGFYFDENYQAFYAIRTEVILEQIVGSGDQMEIQTVAGFPVELDEFNRTATVEVELRSFDNKLRKITYRIKTELELVSRINNFSLQSGVAGNLNGNYQVGSAQTPFVLEAIIRPGGITDSDGDEVPDDIDNCPDDSNSDQLDSDDDDVGNVCDDCPDDPLKSSPGICGCGIADTDTDGDDTPDCNDGCLSDPLKIEPGVCGCGVADTDSDLDTVLDCQDGCPLDPLKTEPGICGCGVPESQVDTDGDNVPDCIDAFPDDRNEWEDTDQDGIGNNADPDDENDRIPDAWELQYGLDPLFDDAYDNPDKDGCNNLKEFKNDTDPFNPDCYLKQNSLTVMQLLLFAKESDEGEIDCSELTEDGCRLPPPSQFEVTIDTDTPGEIYVTFSWSGVECAEGYTFAAGSVFDLIDNPTTLIISRTLPFYQANFSGATPGSTYYWAVASRCNRFTNEAGEWSDVQTFNFNP